MSTEITYRSIFRVLVIGFSIVIVLLLAAAAVAVNSSRSVRESAAALVAEQLTTTRLIEQVESEQQALNAVFYKLSRGPEHFDRDRALSELDETDSEISRSLTEAKGSPEEPQWRELQSASSRFSTEARRLLSESRVSSYSSRDLLRRHEEVTSVIAKLIAAGYQRALTAQRGIENRSARLVQESLILLGACLAASLLCAWLTVRSASHIFARMESQAGELSRVSWHLLENQETTARRFSHELHDELGQSLTAVKANLMAIDPPSGPERDRIEDCRHLVDEAIRNVRELSQLLRPTILDDFGLDASIRWLAERFTQRTGVEVHYRSEFESRLPDETETHLFRIVQEALTNVARHSGATRMEIHLRAENNRVCLSLADNGHGLSAAPNGAGERGMGMIGMRARARSAGGEMTVASKPGEGLRIEVWAPLAPAVASA